MNPKMSINSVQHSAVSY